MAYGFYIQTYADHVELRLLDSPDNASRSLLQVARYGDAFLVLLGRLTYRDELLARLPTGALTKEKHSDADLALAAYHALGQYGIEELEGDFCLVLWDPGMSLLLGSRDPMGGFPIFWAEVDGRVSLSNDVSTLRDLLPSPQLDEGFLAEYLMLPSTGVGEVDGPCAYVGIRRVPAGSLVRVHLPDNRVEVHCFWDWIERATDPGTDRLPELAEQFSACLRLAVAERLRGRVAAHLSGGMDSTSVALLARDELRASGRAEKLHALSLVYELGPVLARETPYIDATLEGQDGIEVHRILGDHFVQFESFGCPPVLDEPTPALLSMGVNRAMVDIAASSGVDTILTGIGGDDVADVRPHHIGDLLRKGRMWAAWREAGRWGHATNNSAWLFFRLYGLAHLVPPSLKGGLSAWIHRGEVEWERQAEGTIPPWISHTFATRHDLYSRGCRHIRCMRSMAPQLGVSLLIAAIRGYAGEANRRYIGAPHGILITHPFLDPRVLCLAIGIHARFRQPAGQMKPLLAQAMRDVLPKVILDRRRKGHGNESYYSGLVRYSEMLERLITEAPVDHLGLLDRSVLRQCLRRMTLGVPCPATAVLRLDLTLSLLRWMTAQAELKPGGHSAEA